MMTRIPNRTFLLPSLVALMWAGGTSDQPAFAQEASQHRLTISQDLEYANVDGMGLELDLYVPQLDSPPPLVVWIHGGGWRAGSRKKLALRSLTEHGYAVASISYRFTDRAIFPAQIYDCKAAIRWLRANADQYGYSGEWIAVAGSSAGGHLALLAGVSGGVDDLEGDLGSHLDQSSTVQAIIDYFRPSDFVLRGKTQPERAYTEESGSFALLGGTPDGKIKPAIETQASPATYVSQDDPPLLVFHGTKDQTVLLDQSQRIVSLYQQAGLPAELVTIEDAGHGGKTFFTPQQLQRVVQFLDQQR